MSTCPKCKKPVDAGAEKCPACNYVLPPPGEGGTLDPTSSLFQGAGPGIDSDFDSTEDGNQRSDSRTIMHGDFAEDDLDFDADGLDGDADDLDFEVEESGTLSADQLKALGQDIAAESAADSIPSDDDLDASQTIHLNDLPADSVDATATLQYTAGSEEEVKSKTDFTFKTKSSKGVWEEATGSTSGRSKTSSSQLVLEASDSIFQRIANRSVADANTPRAADADYQIQDKIGEGGMGIVFSAIQTAVNRKVAVKAMRPKLSEDAARRRQFFYEAEITADLDHPNIPPIYEFGATQEGVYFYSMKHIQGTEWHHVIRKRALPENLEIFNKIIDSVAFSHSKNVIHRDLKPENVILGMFGEVYLTDWGLAVNLTTNPKVPFGGTPDYMAPEMAETGAGRDVGKHSDVYLLGAILFQILTGKPPHYGKNQIEQLDAARRNLIRETDIQDPLMDVAMTAMNTQPVDRYKSVLEMREAIDEIRRHMDSVELTNRATELATVAATEKNYDKFNRSIYGYRDAIELWPGNRAALLGLKDVRLAFGRIAIDRGDYDLALQTLDSSVPVEALEIGKATKAKEAALNREKRIKTLRRAFIGALILFLSIASGLAFYAKRQEGIAVKNAEEATRQTGIALENEEEAKRQAGIALENEKEANNQARIASVAKIQAQGQTVLAQLAQMDAIVQEKVADVARVEEVKAKEELEVKNVELESANVALEKSQNELTEETAQKLGASFSSNSVLAYLQVSNAKLVDAQGLIRGFSETFTPLESSNATRRAATPGNGNESIAAAKIPDINTWAISRLKLLTNQDLAKQPMGSKVSSIDFAQGKNLGVAGTETGEVAWLEFTEGKIVERAKKKVGDRVQSVVVSPAGNEALVAVETQTEGGRSYQMMEWKLDGNSEPVKVEALENRYFQGFRYSPDGTTVITGINRGIWFKSGDGAWGNLANTIRGELKDIGWIDSSNAYVVALFDNQTLLYHVAFNPSNPAAVRTNGRRVELPEDIAASLSTVASLGENRLLLGMNSGALAAFTLSDANQGARQPSLQLSNRIDLPRRHQTAIVGIVNNGQGVFVTRSNEPVAHVWKTAGLAAPEYVTYLSGAPDASTNENNIAGIAFIGEDEVASIDTAGNVVALNIERQQQRRRVVRKSGRDLATNPKAVVGVHPRGDSSTAIAVNADGVVDLWNLQSGQTIPLVQESLEVGEISMEGVRVPHARFSYFGHAPGAELIDSLVDLDAQIIVTVADLSNVDSRYLAVGGATHETCFWEYSTGNLLDRRLDRLESQPRLSLIENGKIFMASRPSKVIDYKQITEGPEKLAFSTEDFFKKSPGFSIPNPANPAVVALARIDGVWLWNPKTGEQSPIQYLGELGQSLRDGIWSEDGERLYILDNQGVLWPLVLQGGNIVSNGKPLKLELPDATQIFSSNQVDLGIASYASGDRLSLTIRSRQVTLHTVVEVTRAGEASVVSSDKIRGLAWLDQKTGKAELGFGSRLRISASSVVKTLRAGGSRFVATKSGNVVEVEGKETSVTLFGTRPLVASTSDRAGEVVWTLHEDGSILRLDIAEAPQLSAWKRQSFRAPGATRFEASPDGTQIAILAGDTLRLFSSANGEVKNEYPDVLQFAWEPSTDAGLAMIKKDGTFDLIGVDVSVPEIAPVELHGGSVPSLHFFTERWTDPQVPANRYLVVQVDSEIEGNNQGALHFVSLTKEGAEAKRFVAPIKGDAKIVISPKDPLVVMGDDAGSVRILYTVPTYGNFNIQCEVETEGDSPIRYLAFGDGGDTLITSDGNARLYGWLSKDKLLGAEPRIERIE